MKICDLEKLKELIRYYIQVLEKEYASVSEILCFNTESFPEWEIMQKWYAERLEQTHKLLDHF